MNQKDIKIRDELVIYSDKKGRVELRADASNETIWGSQDQIAELFDTTKQNIGQHLKAIFNSGELKENSVVKYFFTTAQDGKQYKVKFYNLDAVLSVGYRVNSKKATKFRIWATKTLREYLIKGFMIDGRKIENTSAGFADLRETVDFIESRTSGRVKGTVTLRLKKELI
jgi:hypothetical protein